MTAQIKPVPWQKTLSLDRHTSPPVFNRFLIPRSSGTLPIPNYTAEKVIIPPKRQDKETSNGFSSVYSARLKLQESRRAFLNLSNFPEPTVEEPPKYVEDKEKVEVTEQKKTPSRKISFKCRKASAAHRRLNGGSTKIRANTVAELATKFNQMVTENNAILEEPKFARLVKRVNSQRIVKPDENFIGTKVIRKPSIALKPSQIKNKESAQTHNISREQSQNSEKVTSSAQIHPEKDNSIDEQHCFRARIVFIETPLTPEILPSQKLLRPTNISLNKSPPIMESDLDTPTSVRAKIEQFERRTSPNNEAKSMINYCNQIVPKPKVPEKTINLKTKDLVVREGVKKLKRLEKHTNNILNHTSNENKVEIKTSFNHPDSGEEELLHLTNNYTYISQISVGFDEQKIESSPLDVQIPNKTELLEEEVQILNIPLLPPKRCDSIHETNMKKTAPPHLLKMAKSEEAISPSHSKNASQDAAVKPNTSFLWGNKYDTPSADNIELAFSAPILNVDICGSFEETNGHWEELYDVVNPTLPQISPKNQTSITHSAPESAPEIPPRPTTLTFATNNSENNMKRLSKSKMPLPHELRERPYEKIMNSKGENENAYEYCASSVKYEDIEQGSDDGYEYCEAISPVSQKDQLYEILPSSQVIPPLLPRRKEDPLPPRPHSLSSYCTIQNGENGSVCYESVYNASTHKTVKLNKGAHDMETISNIYESICCGQSRDERWESSSNRESLLSADQTNSIYDRTWPNDENIYMGKAASDLSSSDKSDEWVDISDGEDNGKEGNGFVVIKNRQKNNKKASEWSRNVRYQWNKSKMLHSGDSDSDHVYEILHPKNEESQDHDDIDSFDSDTDSETSFSKINHGDSGVDISNCQLPDPPNNQSHRLSRLAVSAGKHIKQLKTNWSLTKNDITKYISRTTKRKSKADLEGIDVLKIKEDKPSPTNSKPPSQFFETHSTTNLSTQNAELRGHSSDQIATSYQNLEASSKETSEGNDKKNNSLGRKKFLDKIKRNSIELATSITQNLGDRSRSTFYVTDTIDIDSNNQQSKTKDRESISPKANRRRSGLNRPQSPPPPVPTEINHTTDGRRTTSWYAECGVFKNSESLVIKDVPKRPNTSWYAEIGLYQTSTSTPSTSSTENSGNTTTVNIITPNINTLNLDKNSEEYYNYKNEHGLFNKSNDSISSTDTKMDNSLNLTGDIHTHLQEEPLYQFYDAAVLESVCQGGTSDFEYDGYEEVGDHVNSDHLRSRPSAMQLIGPSKNGSSISRTLWCEIPEVIQSSVLSTIDNHQKKVQEAKFEMMTSEASYLNSLNVLCDHFLTNLSNCDYITSEELDILFGNIQPVKRCSEKLLYDLEKCWQENILLHGVCEIIKKHAEENFIVYVTYCENQVFLDSTLKKLKARSGFADLLRHLENSGACQSLTLHSFLMLPMQRITRWPLLVDAVLKRLSQQDNEYLPCQYALATLNKIVNQCNEGARKKERETEMKKYASQIEFPKSVPPFEINSGSRWLIRNGSITQLVPRTDDGKLTFGRRFSKVPLYLFLFNDLFLITKVTSEGNFIVIQYCIRSYIELNNNELLTLPTKETQGRNLLFLTMLENHEGKTVEMLLSCDSESNKERWIEALSPPKSENPDETLYDCWDCPQVTAIHNYTAHQPDELAVSRGDIINVTRKMADGWYHGERIRDGQTGWFPANYTMEVANPHVRARNLKQRYRLLAFSENYLKSK